MRDLGGGRLSLAGLNDIYIRPGTTDVLSATEADTQLVLKDTYIIFNIGIRFTGSITGSITLTFTIRKNGANTPLSIVLNASSGGFGSLTTTSVKFLPGDLISAQLVSFGNPGAGTFTSICYLY